MLGLGRSRLYFVTTQQSTTNHEPISEYAQTLNDRSILIHWVESARWRSPFLENFPPKGLHSRDSSQNSVTSSCSQVGRHTLLLATEFTLVKRWTRRLPIYWLLRCTLVKRLPHCLKNLPDVLELLLVRPFRNQHVIHLR